MVLHLTDCRAIPVAEIKIEGFLSCFTCLLSLMEKLEIHQLTKQYGDHIVLNQLTFKTDCTVLGIAGPNGSGKSTLLRCIAGLLKPNSGRISLAVGNRELTPADLNGEVGYTAPYVELYEWMSATENLQFVQDLKRHKNTDTLPDIGQLLVRCQANSFSDQLYGDLSTGQRQRVKLAASLVHDPLLLCLDEPGSNLDADGRKLIEITVAEFARPEKLVVIASNQSDELDYCDELISLDNR